MPIYHFQNKKKKSCLYPKSAATSHLVVSGVIILYLLILRQTKSHSQG